MSRPLSLNKLDLAYNFPLSLKAPLRLLSISQHQTTFFLYYTYALFGWDDDKVRMVKV